MFWLDQEAKQTLFNFLWSHRDQRNYIAADFPLNENIIDMLKDPRVLARNVRVNSMLRIIDLKTVLEGLGLMNDDFNLAFKVNDAMCPWNNTIFQLNSADDKLIITSKVDNKNLDFEIDILYLNQLIAGYRTVHELSELGRIKLHSNCIEILDKIFPRTNNYFHDFF